MLGMREAEIGRPAASEREAASVCRFAERLAASSLGVDVDGMRSAERGNARVAFARHTAMYLAHIHLGLSFSAIGRAFGRDRTTVAHACARIEDRREDPRIDRILDCLEAALDLWRQRILSAEDS